MLDECIVQSNRIEREPDDDQDDVYKALFKSGPPGSVGIKFMRQAHRQLFQDRPETFPGHFRSDDEVPAAAQEVWCINTKGDTHHYMSSEEIPDALATLVRDCQDRFHALCMPMSAKKRHTCLIDYLAFFHQKFLSIHPFVDGNGRTARLFTWCIMKGFFKDPVLIVEENYFELLELCDEKKDHSYLKPIFANVPEFPEHKVENEVEDDSDSYFDIDDI